MRKKEKLRQKEKAIMLLELAHEQLDGIEEFQPNADDLYQSIKELKELENE